MSNTFSTDMLLQDLTGALRFAAKLIDDYFLERIGKPSDEFDKYVSKQEPILINRVFKIIHTFNSYSENLNKLSAEKKKLETEELRKSNVIRGPWV